MDKKSWKKVDLLLGMMILLLGGFSLGLFVSNHLLTSSIEKKQSEIYSLKEEVRTREVEYEQLQEELVTAQALVVKEITGFLPAELEKDDTIIRSYLEKIFTWKNGQEYDRQRAEIKAIGAGGSEKLLKNVMTENYRVPVPEELKGTIKDNDIDVNGLKSLLTNYQTNRIAWSKSSDADVLYTSRIQYQVYINEEDLSGEHKTVRNLLFTFKLSGIGENRKVVDVQYAFID
ncbi:MULTISPECIES: hypothetical protein [unclassified Streptococcus]|uniref:hypothetical protein n=1 Tax=unclassified Streptococcus TaxID=2608887 RepID=UPI00211B2D6E|nr:MULTISPECIES: hypothetical protein [unclassified Streptococcus]MCQ9212413.1 hypothetical protein [Streptococcus sp. B01]MCQ9213751.1 hypothetical protein [Streptococcus sp. O1]